MNGHITSIIRCRYEIANQLLFSIDVATTMNILADTVEDKATLSCLTLRVYLIETCCYCFLERTIWLMHSSTLSTDERRALNRLTRVRVSRSLVFSRLLTNGTILYSIQYGRPGGKRGSTKVVVPSVALGVANLRCQKFCLCECSPFNVNHST